MPYRYTCRVCEREFRADTREDAVSRAKDHFDRQHEGEIGRKEALQTIVQE